MFLANVKDHKLAKKLAELVEVKAKVPVTIYDLGSLWQLKCSCPQGMYTNLRDYVDGVLDGAETITPRTFDKITTGFVIQTFNDAGECIRQEFIAGDQVDYEFDGYPINVTDMPLKGDEYQPFNMVQPLGETNDK